MPERPESRSFLDLLFVFMLAGALLAPSIASAKETDSGPILHPGFESGVLLGGGVVQSSLAAEDIDMDGLPELVVGGNEGILYAYNGDGTPVLDQKIKDEEGAVPPAIGQLYSTGDGEPILSSPTLADVDSDRRVDIFFGNDAGKVFHLEVVLSTDAAKTRSQVARQVSQTPTERYRRYISAASPEEEDDLGGR